jgi:hypothetical protein
VNGKYPADLIKDAGADPDKVYTFQVRDLAGLMSRDLLVKGHTYYFNNDHGSPFLEPFPEGYGPEGY